LERVGHPKFFVFSDDPKWARENLVFRAPAEFVENNLGATDHEDFRLMTLCRHFIVANSTFSWWAAWLGGADRAEKIVIAPTTWRLDGNPIDLVPDEWIRC
jgi:hypothetical protein